MTHFELMNELENYTLEGLRQLQHRIARLIDEEEQEELREEESNDNDANFLSDRIEDSRLYEKGERP